MWKMPARCKAAVAQVAPAQRVLMAGLIKSLEEDGVRDVNDRVSFLSEVLAAQFNLMVGMMRARRADIAPNRPLADLTLEEIAIADMMSRARMRRMRGDDQ
jgi:hypothetical protein